MKIICPCGMVTAVEPAQGLCLSPGATVTVHLGLLHPVRPFPVRCAVYPVIEVYCSFVQVSSQKKRPGVATRPYRPPHGGRTLLSLIQLRNCHSGFTAPELSLSFNTNSMHREIQHVTDLPPIVAALNFPALTASAAASLIP